MTIDKYTKGRLVDAIVEREKGVAFGQICKKLEDGNKTNKQKAIKHGNDEAYEELKNSRSGLVAQKESILAERKLLSDETFELLHTAVDYADVYNVLHNKYKKIIDAIYLELGIEV